MNYEYCCIPRGFTYHDFLSFCNAKSKACVSHIDFLKLKNTTHCADSGWRIKDQPIAFVLRIKDGGYTVDNIDVVLLSTIAPEPKPAPEPKIIKVTDSVFNTGDSMINKIKVFTRKHPIKSISAATLVVFCIISSMGDDNQRYRTVYSDTPRCGNNSGFNWHVQKENLVGWVAVGICSQTKYGAVQAAKEFARNELLAEQSKNNIITANITKKDVVEFDVTGGD